MNENRSFASLGPTLLARKGGARPAMRPQLGMTPMGATALAASLDDLGWNDMGEDEPETVAPPSFVAEVVPIHAEPAAPAIAAPVAEMPEPAVKQQLRAIAEHMERQDRKERETRQAPGKPASTSLGKTARKPAALQGRRAAFTLRLDDERHLKLRLACTVQNRSAQMLLIEMLDQYLAGTPDIVALAAQVKRS